MNYHEKYKSFYQQKKWRDLRQQVFLEANGLCEECLKKKIIMEGKEVHHRVSIESDWSKRYERNNLILLCSDCHNKIHNRQSPLQQFNKFWEELNGK